MAKTINGVEVDADGIEWGVEVELAGEPVVLEAGDEEAARLEAVAINGKLRCREWFVTSWADAPAT